MMLRRRTLVNYDYGNNIYAFPGAWMGGQGVSTNNNLCIVNADGSWLILAKRSDCSNPTYWGYNRYVNSQRNLQMENYTSFMEIPTGAKRCRFSVSDTFRDSDTYNFIAHLIDTSGQTALIGWGVFDFAIPANAYSICIRVSDSTVHKNTWVQGQEKTGKEQFGLKLFFDF